MTILLQKEYAYQIGSIRLVEGKVRFLSVVSYTLLTFVGRSLVDSFTNSLKDMASHMRREADFWNSQSDQFHKWPNIKQTYTSAIDVLPPFPPEQHNDHNSMTIPSVNGSISKVGRYLLSFLSKKSLLINL
jgi:hypothetical protein